MFERLTAPVRQTLIEAEGLARRLRATEIRPGHLLAATLDTDPSLAGLLADRNLDRTALERTMAEHRQFGEADAAALRTLGIDLDVVRASVEARFGAGALDRPGMSRNRPRRSLPFSPEAKKTIERSLRESLRLRQRNIRLEHLVLAVLQGGDPEVDGVLRRAGVDVRRLCSDLETVLRLAG